MGSVLGAYCRCDCGEIPNLMGINFSFLDHNNSLTRMAAPIDPPNYDYEPEYEFAENLLDGRRNDVVIA
jgi:hypothetical protein